MAPFTPTAGPWDTYDPSSKPPPFGHALKKYFALDEDYVNLNHASYGFLPHPVLFAMSQLSSEVESNPDKFHRFKFKTLLVQTREALAKLIGVDTDEVVMTPNVSTALNTVLRNFEWRHGDLLIGASTTYYPVANAIKSIADPNPGRPTALSIQYDFPLTHAQILAVFRAKLREFKQAHAHTQFTDVPPILQDSDAATKGNKIVVVIDAMTANPGVLMPWQEMVRIAHEEGAWTVIDAAHSIGQEVDLDLTAAKPDFWFSNLHKWLFVKRGCAVLYVPKRNQYIIKTSLPTSNEYASPGTPAYGKNFVLAHQYTATSDFVTYCTIPDALAFRQWLGGEKAINDYCHKTAIGGAKKLVEVLGTRDIDISGELTLNMPNVQLPLPVEKYRGELYTAEQIAEVNKYLQEKLLFEWNTYAAHFFHNGAFWCRCSTQVFNEVSDFEYLGKAFNAVCQEIKDTILSPQNAA